MESTTGTKGRFIRRTIPPTGRSQRTFSVDDLRISHFGYLTEDAKMDPNCVFPIERLRELEAEGIIGELADPAYTAMGGVYSARRVREDLAPRIVERILQSRADILYLVPA